MRRGCHTEHAHLYYKSTTATIIITTILVVSASFLYTFLILSFVCCWSFNFFIGFPWPWVSFCVGSCRRRKWMWRPYFLDCFLPCGYRRDDDERVLPFFLLVFLFFFIFSYFSVGWDFIHGFSRFREGGGGCCCGHKLAADGCCWP